MKQALFPLNFDIKLLQESNIAQVLVEYATISLGEDALGFLLTKEAKGHYSLGYGGEGKLLAVHVSRVGNKDSYWHFLGNKLLFLELVEF